MHQITINFQEKQGGKDTNRFADEIVAMTDNVEEYKFFSETQHQTNVIPFWTNVSY